MLIQLLFQLPAVPVLREASESAHSGEFVTLFRELRLSVAAVRRGDGGIRSSDQMQR